MKNKNINEKYKTLVFGITLLSIVVIIGVGFAFFSSSLSNANNENVAVETANISLKFDDNDNGISGTLNLGESIIKKFTLENTGTNDAYARINFIDLVNTYTFRSLSYTLEQSNAESGTYTKIASELVPTSNTSSTKTLKDNILVPVNTKYYYKLTITLNNLEINQNEDISASLNSKFGIEESTAERNTNLATKYIKNLVLENGNPSLVNEIDAESANNTCTNTLAYDGTNDNNLRYVGANPCNYVSFNNELWRIIGVMNNISDNNNYETRLKLIRKDSLGDYSWDTSSSDINSGYGINEWTQSDIKNELNGDYLNTSLSENTYWYNGRNNKMEGEYDYTKGLKTDAQALIGNAKWFLGSCSNYHYAEINARYFYEHERGPNEIDLLSENSCNDGFCPRDSQWVGEIALPYPSDYGYAVGGDVRNICLEKKLYNYSENECYLNNWITPQNTLWFLNSYYRGLYNSFRLTNTGVVHNYATLYNFGVYPVTYLKSNVLIIEGDGSEANPYVLGLQ